MGGYFVVFDVLDRHRVAGGPAGQRGRHRPHTGRRLLPLRARPARPEHPAGADVPFAGPGGDGHGRRRDLRGSGRRREAGPSASDQVARRPGGRVAGMSDDQLQPDDTLDDKYDEPGHEDVLDGGHDPRTGRGVNGLGVPPGRSPRRRPSSSGSSRRSRPGLGIRRLDNESGMDDPEDMVGGDDPDAIPAEDDFVGDGGRQVGRLVAPDSEFGEDEEKDWGSPRGAGEVADDVGLRRRRRLARGVGHAHRHGRTRPIRSRLRDRRPGGGDGRLTEATAYRSRTRTR